MLEILAVIFLCRKNSNNAMVRGRSKGWAIAYTILLWIGFEILGAVVLTYYAYNGGGSFAHALWEGYPMSMMLPMLAFAAVGGLISWLIARRGQPVHAPGVTAFTPQEMMQISTAQPLQTTCTVVVIRDGSFVGAAVGYSFYLNGQPIGTLKNNTQMMVRTPVVQNLLVATDIYGFRTQAPLPFIAPEGGTVELHFKGGRFRPEMTRAIPGQPGAAAPQGYGYPPVAPQQQAPAWPQQPGQQPAYGQAPPPVQPQQPVAPQPPAPDAQAPAPKGQSAYPWAQTAENAPAPAAEEAKPQQPPGDEENQK